MNAFTDIAEVRICLPVSYLEAAHKRPDGGPVFSTTPSRNKCVQDMKDSELEADLVAAGVKVSYLRALNAPDAIRVGLDGQTTVPFTDAAQKLAQRRLRAITARKKGV